MGVEGGGLGEGGSEGSSQTGDGGKMEVEVRFAEEGDRGGKMDR